MLASLLALTACGGEQDPSSNASPSVTAPSTSATPTPSAEPIKASKNLDAIKVTGDYGKSPKVEVKAPWGIDKSRNEVLKESDGAPIKEGDYIEVNYMGVNGRTGETFDESFSGGKAIAFSVDQVVAGFKAGLVGQKLGSRVLLAMPGKEGYDPQGGNAQAGINIGDSLIFVVDIVGVQLAGPVGKAVKAKDGLPTVSGKEDAPKVTIPKSDPPKELQIQPLIKGEGKKVTETDGVTIQYQWITWSDGKVVEQNYGKAAETVALNTLLPGVVKGLTDQTVGSRVLIVIPPGADGYPDGNATPKIDKTDTLVFVVDILFTQAGQ